MALDQSMTFHKSISGAMTNPKIVYAQGYNVLTATWETYLLICAPNEDSNQPAHPCCLIRLFVVRMKKLKILYYPKWAQWSFWWDCEGAGWSDCSQGARQKVRFLTFRLIRFTFRKLSKLFTERPFEIFFFLFFRSRQSAGNVNWYYLAGKLWKYH